MKFKTRLRVTFLTIIVLPLLLTALSFIVIGIYLMNVQQGVGFQEIDYSLMSENVQEFTSNTDRAYFTLLEQARTDSRKLDETREVLLERSRWTGLWK